MKNKRHIWTIIIAMSLIGIAVGIMPVYANEPGATINCWRGQDTSADCTSGTDRNTPFWSGDDTYGWDVYFNNNGDTMCVQYKVGTGSYQQTACSFVDSTDHWYCSFDAGSVSNQTVYFEFYNDNDNDSGESCNIGGDEHAWSGEQSFSTGPTAVTLSDLSARATSPALLVASVLLLGAVIVWRRKRA
jgi:hypothetical protein